MPLSQYLGPPRYKILYLIKTTELWNNSNMDIYTWKMNKFKYSEYLRISLELANFHILYKISSSTISLHLKKALFFEKETFHKVFSLISCSEQFTQRQKKLQKYDQTLRSGIYITLHDAYHCQPCTWTQFFVITSSTMELQVKKSTVLWKWLT